MEIICREGVLGYAPHPSISGEPGQFLIDPNASILAISALFLVKNKFALERFNQIYNNLNSNDKFLVDNLINVCFKIELIVSKLCKNLNVCTSSIAIDFRNNFCSINAI